MCSGDGRSNSQGVAIEPNISRVAAAAAPSAEMALLSIDADLVGRIEGGFASTLYAALVAVVRSQSALPLTLRIQPRTVSAGSPSSAAMVR